MNFDPQIPEWGKEFTNNSKEELLKYHSWIKNTGIKSGLISPKSDQFIWDEFVIHSLYFYKIIFDLNLLNIDIYDLGTGGGIPGIPVGIVSNNTVNLIDIKQKRIFELERFLATHKHKNIKALKADAEIIIQKQENSIFLMRCYMPKNDLIKKLKKYMLNNKKNTFIVYSKANNADINVEAFHVKQEKFLINKDEYRFIDVITVK